MRPLPRSIAQRRAACRRATGSIATAAWWRGTMPCIINTAAGYRAFLAQYPDSDLTATARKLEERLRNRPEFGAGGCRCQRRRAAERLAGRADLSLQHAAAHPQPLKKVDAPREARRAGSAEARHRKPPRRVSPTKKKSWSFAVRRRPGVRAVRSAGRASASASVWAEVIGGRWRRLRRRRIAAGVDTEAAMA